MDDVIILIIITIIVIIIIAIILIIYNNSNNDVLYLKSIRKPLEINSNNINNLSVIKLEEKYIGVVTSYDKSKKYYKPVYVEIFRNTNIKFLELIDFKDDNGIEDSRIFKFKNDNWVIGNCLGHKDQKYNNVNTMCIFKLDDYKNTFRLLCHPENPTLLQKNYSPFIHDNKLYYECSIAPHVICEINPEKGSVDKIIYSDNYKFDIKCGRLIGGTPLF